MTGAGSALILTARANGVSRLHGGVSRTIWPGVHGASRPDDLPIGHVTNGVHPPSWMCPDLGRLLDRHLGEGWSAPGRVTDPATWRNVDEIPDADRWEVRRVKRSSRTIGPRFCAAHGRAVRGRGLPGGLSGRADPPPAQEIGVSFSHIAARGDPATGA